MNQNTTTNNNTKKRRKKKIKYRNNDKTAIHYVYIQSQTKTNKYCQHKILKQKEEEKHCTLLSISTQTHYQSNQMIL